MTYVIRTSDRGMFKRCREQWNFASKIRMNYEPNTEDQALRFGTAIHAGLETYYDPRTWGMNRSMVEAMAVAAFLQAYPQPEHLDDEQIVDYRAEVALGKAMLEGYFAYAKANDTFTPVAVELEFEVRIPWAGGGVFGDIETYGTGPFWHYSMNDDGLTASKGLTYNNQPVVYQGRVDALVQDNADGSYWIVDHKSTGRFDDTTWLPMDEQCGSYMWALQEQLGLDISGVIYNELLKAAPHEPKVLKGGKLSTDKRQNTTYKLYLDTIHRLGYNEDDYADMLGFLREQPNKFFRRTQVHRSPRELELLGERIALEAIDMLDSPSIYPNPGRFTCGRCAFKAPCLAKADGSDYQWMLAEGFHVRES